jgi:protein-S-isoprenylcysteine O-methyltransferase Ste14
MKLFPDLRLGLQNGWALFAIYAIGLILTVATFSKEARSRLFYEPREHIEGIRKIILLVGRLSAITIVISMFFSPLQLGSVFFILGMVIYALGYATVIGALLEYKHSPQGQPATEGLYRISRNPQWVGLVLVFLGISIMVASWLHLLLLLVLVWAYHFQILAEEEACFSMYDEVYQEYMNRVPRYLLFSRDGRKVQRLGD